MNGMFELTSYHESWYPFGLNFTTQLRDCPAAAFVDLQLSVILYVKQSFFFLYT